MTDTSPPTPKDLIHRGPGRKFWRTVLKDYSDLRADQIVLLTEVCRQLDVLEDLRTRVEDEGAMLDQGKGPRAHPALVEARQIRQEMRRTLGQLALPPLPDEQAPPKLAPIAWLDESKAIDEIKKHRHDPRIGKRSRRKEQGRTAT